MSSSRILVAGVLLGATLVLAPVAASAVTLFDNGPAAIGGVSYCTSNNCGSGTRYWLGTNNQFADFGYSFVVPFDGSSTLPGGGLAGGS